MQSWLELWGVVVVAGTVVACGGDDSSSPTNGASTLDGGTSQGDGDPPGTTPPGTTPPGSSDGGSSPGTDGGGATKGDGGSGSGAGRESWVWVFTNWKTSLSAIGANKGSFTHVMPAFYTLNYGYSSGVAYWANCPNGGGNSFVCTGNGTDDFDGSTSAQIASQVKGMGLQVVPLIYAGADNGGTDQGVQAILNDPTGVQAAFISAMVSEAVTKGYSGYNLDWELGSTSGGTGAAYADKFVAFVNAFKTELDKHGMSLSLATISANLNGTWCSSNNGFADLAKLQASKIDRVMIEDYDSTLGGPSTSCRKQTAKPIDCPSDVIGFYDIMCTFMAYDKIVIALDSIPTSANPIAGGIFSSMRSYGITKVAVWPDANSDGAGGTYAFLDTKGISPAGATWYGLLKSFLAP